MTETVAERLARRYPPSRVPGRFWILLAVALAALGTAWLLWAGSVGANPAVSGRVDSFQVTSDSEVRVKVTIDRPDPAMRARCLVFAQAVSFERVGELPLEVPPGQERLVVRDLTIRTFKRATAVSLESCQAIR